MKRVLVLLFSFLFIASFCSNAQMTFFLIDNFEDGDYSRNPEWFSFDNVELNVVKNNKEKGSPDFISDSCGLYSLQVKGRARNWYVGGIGTNMSVNASDYSRLQIDVYGHDKYSGKVKVELYEDDNNNNKLEQDSEKGWIPTKDDKWVAEVNILGKGFTRVSIPFSAFRDDNPKVGNNRWDPNTNGKSGGLLKCQIVFIGESEKAPVDLRIDNIILTN